MRGLFVKSSLTLSEAGQELWPHLPARHVSWLGSYVKRGSNPGGRERKTQTFRSLVLETSSAVYNAFYTQRHLTSRAVLRKYRGEAFCVWKEAPRAGVKRQRLQLSLNNLT